MKTARLLAALVFLTLTGAYAQDAHWYTDYKDATTAAKADHKNILMDFTGSDWCEWCIRMDKEVLDTKQFKDFADKNLVLMQADFPQGKQLPQKTQQQNNDLQSRYAVEGFPTFILTDPDGNVLGRQVGYVAGGPTAFIAMIDKMSAKK
ncbi:MAG TPA: thioredoxin family protein [Chthoniobacteraceae bacterium]|jgi:thioredoxin-related protein|nr:thioredoxin family protein [Chthoniobacteraceae bacterium]